MNDKIFLEEIMRDVKEYFLKDNTGYVISPGYEFFREIITLYAKQHNLVESTLLLLDNNMCEEAYILARSAITNYFTIGYLLNDGPSRKRLKFYQMQPIMSDIYLLKNMRKIIKSAPFKDSEEIKQKFSKEIINNKIKEYENILIYNGIEKDSKPLSVSKMAQNGFKTGFEIYATIYAESSKYEHSDISSLNVYKKQVDDYSNNEAFVLNMGATNEELKDNIYRTLIIAYCDCFSNIMNYIDEKEKHLEINYDMKQLTLIVSKIIAYV